MKVESITHSTSRRVMLVLTGGGTGGHISPIVAVVEHLRSAGVPADFHWVGSRHGPERDTAHQLGIPFSSVATGKLRRYFSFSTALDAVRVPLGVVQAARLLRKLRPDVVFSTGGFVGVPAVAAARICRVPSLTHEQTATLGLATKINSRFSDVIALSFAQAPERTTLNRARLVVTGNPVRQAVLEPAGGDVAEQFGFDPSLPLVYVTGGMLGAHAINNLIKACLPTLLVHANILHQCGPASTNGDYTDLCHVARDLPYELRHRYRVVELVKDEIGAIYAAAALVVGRAGAGTVAELAAVGKPSILIPLPGAEEQWRNAQTLAATGAAIVTRQEDADPGWLLATLSGLIADRDRMQAMGDAARSIAPANAVERLSAEILRLAESRGQTRASRRAPLPQR